MKKIIVCALVSCLSPLAMAQQKAPAVQIPDDVPRISDDTVDVSPEISELPSDFVEVTQKLDAIVLKRTGKRMFEQPVGIEWKANDVSVSVQNPRTGKKETIKVARHSSCC